MDKRLEQLKGHLIVSCQALPHEPLHSSFIMGRMAKAAAEGGALGIRANTKEDIAEIKQNVDYKAWLFGHMHQNKTFHWERSSCLYEQIIRIL